MNITITITNPTVNVLTALAGAHAADPQDTALRIASVADVDNYLDVGSEVHWQGAKFVFDGVVERIDDEVVSPDAGLEYLDDKAVFIRRNDTGQLVSLTLRDLQTGRLTLID